MIFPSVFTMLTLAALLQPVVTATPFVRPDFPNTIFWNQMTLARIQQLVNVSLSSGYEASLPSWIAPAVTKLKSVGEARLSLKSFRGTAPDGPWRVNHPNSTVAPSGNQQDFASISTYSWPCTTTCAQAAATQGARFTEDECSIAGNWDMTMPDGYSCNLANGQPYLTSSLSDGHFVFMRFSAESFPVRMQKGEARK